MSGPVNDKYTPVEMPRNELTQMMEAVAARNQRGTSLSPEEIAAGVPISGTPLPTARSADLGRALPVEDPNRGLSRTEAEDLDRMAIESGLVRGPVTPGIAQALDSEDMGPYRDLASAIAAGAPVDADPTAVAEAASRFSEAPAPAVRMRSPRMAIGAADARMTAREFIANAAPQLPRLPDFKKVQMIDMVNGKVYVDGLEFDVTKAELATLRKFCVTKAKEQVQASLDAALKALSEDTDGAGATSV